MSEWLFDKIKVGDQVVFDERCLKTVCYVTDTCFDVESIRFRKRDGKPVKSRYPAKVNPISQEWIQYLKEEYGISPNKDQQHEPITLTLTREQAELLIETFDAIFDYDYFLILDELKKQIEEKLK